MVKRKSFFLRQTRGNETDKTIRQWTRIVYSTAIWQSVTNTWDDEYKNQLIDIKKTEKN